MSATACRSACIRTSSGPCGHKRRSFTNARKWARINASSSDSPCIGGACSGMPETGVHLGPATLGGGRRRETALTMPECINAVSVRSYAEVVHAVRTFPMTRLSGEPFVLPRHYSDVMSNRPTASLWWGAPNSPLAIDPITRLFAPTQSASGAHCHSQNPIRQQRAGAFHPNGECPAIICY